MQTKLIVIALITWIAVGSHTQATAGPGQRVKSGDAALNALDTDGDGVVSLGEFTQARLTRAENRFDRRDKNGDGLITDDEIGRDGEPGADSRREEMRQCISEQLGIELPEPPEPGSRFGQADLNGDGAVDLAEALTLAEQAAENRFTALDSNADGVLDIDELSAAVGRGRAFREARRTCREQLQEVNELLGA